MSEELKQKMTEIASKRAATRTKFAELMVTSNLSEKAAEHAANHFVGLLDGEVDEDEAMERAAAEEKRFLRHLHRTAEQHANGDVVKHLLPCAQCKADTQHACVPDDNGEIVATCLCGRFKKLTEMPQ